MGKNIFQNKKSNTVDKPLSEFVRIKEKKEQIIKEEIEAIDNIRRGLEEIVIMLIDMVDSTKFKLKNQDTPEKWILRVKQFSEIVEEYAKECGGRVVKYIGDELLIIFNRKSMIPDSINLISRIKNLQDDISEITEETTKVKVAVDFGKVFFLEYQGHSEPDPQGQPVDRCSRIAKLCQPGICLASFDFVNNTENPKMWTNVGEDNLKGIGLTRIFQFGDSGPLLTQMIQISKLDHEENIFKINNLKSENEELQLKLKDATLINKKLNDKIKKLGGKVEESLVVEKQSNEDKCKQSWNKIRKKISNLKELIETTRVPSNEYARFLFLYMSDMDWEYNSYTGNTFDSSIERKLVTFDYDNLWHLAKENRRNSEVIKLMNEIEYDLEIYENKCRRENDDEDLFDYSLKTPEFWEDVLGYSVVR